MAALSHDPATTLDRIVLPVVGREEARVDAIVHQQGMTALCVVTRDFGNQGSETPIEANHDVTPACRPRSLDLGELVQREGERLLCEDVLSSGQRLHDQGGV